jgi:hypothetical protein
MRITIRTCAAWLVAMAALSLCVPVFAQQAEKAEPGNIADTWIIWPQDGHEKEFEAALKNHAAWRKQNGETFVWQIYQPIVGDDLTYYVIRSGDHHWKDFDGNREWGRNAKAGDEFERSVGPHVAKVEHYFDETQAQFSHWAPSEDYRYFGVSELQLKPGMYGQMTEALTKLHKAAVDGKYSRSFSIAWNVGGKGGMMVIWPYRTYAEMADPEPSIMKLMDGSLGSEESARATMKQLQTSFEDSHYTLYVHRPDLSTPK